MGLDTWKSGKVTPDLYEICSWLMPSRLTEENRYGRLVIHTSGDECEACIQTEEYDDEGGVIILQWDVGTGGSLEEAAENAYLLWRLAE